MTIPAGTRLGPYELSEMLGAGGMGEVYKARDTRLERNVAIKVLPAHLSSNPSLRERFEREAKTISAITHPNICALFDIGDAVVGVPRRGAREELEADDGRADGAPLQQSVQFLVMEYLEGESLAERLAKGPLPLEHVLRYGVEIASALDKAHRAGIIHRDLKPGNIMITKSGAKLLDFGLAKYAQSAQAIENLTSLPTEHKPLTQEGTILGTFQYMAPEQLAGEEADTRTDIFALGAVLYEMLTGTRAFQGKNKTSLIGAIVSGEPRPVSALQPLTPPALEHVIKKCLAKDPDDRLQSAHDIAEELKWISEAGSQAGVATPLTIKRKTRERLAWSVAAVLAIAVALSSYLAVQNRNTAPSQFYRTSIVLPSYLDYFSGPMAISPDGKAVAYAAPNENGQRILWVRRFDDAAPQPLPATTEAFAPFWSADGQTLGYFTFRKLNRISAAGGQPEVIADAAGGVGATWNREGAILFAPNGTSPILRVAASGGDAVAVTKPEAMGHRSHRWPHFLPDGKRFLFLALRILGNKATEGIYLASTDGKEEPRFLTDADSNAVYVEPGFLVFSRGGILRVQRIDIDRGEMIGEPASVGPLQYSSRFAAAMFSATPNALVYQEKGTEILTELKWVDRTGKTLGSLGTAYYWSPRLSGDGKRVAVDKSVSSGNGDIWILETSRPGATRFTMDESNETLPIWTKGDASLIYMINPQRAGTDALIKPLKPGSSSSLLLGDPKTLEFPTDVSRDGRYLLYVSEAISQTAKSSPDIHVYSFADRTSTPFLTSPATEDAAMFSPDGKWVAYISDESGRNEVYVQSFPTPSAQWQVSTSGGTMPKWSPTGRELFYLSADGKLTSVPVRLGDTFESEEAVPLFAVRLRDDTSTQYDISPDGSRFLLNAIAPREDPPLSVLIHWQERYKP